MDQAAAAAGERAVLAELKAIGLSFAAGTGVLRPVQAREVRSLARRLVGSTDLLGQVFRWEGEEYLVNDIAPGPTLWEAGDARVPAAPKGTTIVTILITKIQAAARGLNTP